MRLPLSVALAVLVALVLPAQDAAAQVQRGGRITKGYNSGGLTRSVARNVPPAYLEFATPSGTGLPVAEDLCSALAAEVPNWATPVGGGAGNWCIGGDGQEVAGSEADFSPAGSPVASSPSFCPSGLDCATKTATWLGTISDGHASAAKTSTSAAPMSVCWLGMHTTDAVWDNFLFGPGWSMTLKSDTAYRFTIAGTETSTGGLSLLAVNLVCGTYSGTAKGYFNGTPGSTSGALTRAAATTANMLRGYPSASLTFGAFYVDQELSAAKIAAIARRVLADAPKAVVQGSPSLALTYTRSGVSYCAKSDNTGTLLSPNRPCVSQNGVLVEATATNRVARSQEFNDAAWTKAAGATITANYAIAPDGTKTAERIVYDATSSYVLINDSTGTVQTTQSVYLKGTSGSGAIDFCRGGGVGQCVVCSYTSTEWSRCTHTSTYATSTSGFLGCDAPTKGSACSAAGDVLVWGYQHELGAVATSYIPTTSAAATRGEAIPYFDFGASIPTFSMAATAVVPTSGWPTFPSSVGDLLSATSPVSSGAVRVLGWNTFAAVGGIVGTSGGANYSLPYTFTLYRANAGGRSWMQYDSVAPSVLFSINGTGPTTFATSLKITPTKLGIGNNPAGGAAFEGRISNVCFDTNPARCR